MFVVIVSGLSGAGKSVTIKAFEDLGFYCADNLPTALIPTFTDLLVQSNIERVALGIDIRERHFLDGLFEVLTSLQGQGHHLELLFLEASDDVLLRRYSETRRKHPLAMADSVPHGITLERELLASLRQRATRIIDTSALTLHELRALVQAAYRSQSGDGRMQVSVVSFGFKYGAPTNTDLLFDVRFLPNPHFDPDLRAHTGQEPEVAAYVLENPMGRTFVQHLYDFLGMLMPLYEQEGKAYLMISIGCTGGKHRSVAMTESVVQHLRHLGYRVSCQHRDVAKDG
jgi:UPF0042 nucleotide-binding protein